MNFQFHKAKHRFSLDQNAHETSILIDGMLVGCITKIEDRGIFRINLARSLDHPSRFAWAVLKQSFGSDSLARKFLTQHIDEILTRFDLYPIIKL